MLRAAFQEASPARVMIAAALALFVTATIAGTGLHFSHNYTASSYLLGKLNTTRVAQTSPLESNNLPAVAQQLLTDNAVSEIDQRLHPYSAVASKLFPKWTVNRLRSQLSIQSTYSGNTIGAITVMFRGSDRQTTVAVTSAVSDLLLRPPALQSRQEPATSAPFALPDSAPANPEATSAAPAMSPAGQEASAPPQTKAADQPRPAPATAVEAPKPGPAANLQRDSTQARATRIQLGELWRETQDLKAEIQSEADSLAAIETEKQRIQQAAQTAEETSRREPATTATAVADPRRQILLARLAAYNKTLAALRERYTEDYPDVANARERVIELQSEIANLPPPQVPPPPVHHEAPRTTSDVPERLAALDAREVPINASLKSMRQEVSSNQAQIAVLKQRIVEYSSAATPSDPAVTSSATQPAASSRLA